MNLEEEESNNRGFPIGGGILNPPGVWDEVHSNLGEYKNLFVNIGPGQQDSFWDVFNMLVQRRIQGAKNISPFLAPSSNVSTGDFFAIRQGYMNAGLGFVDAIVTASDYGGRVRGEVVSMIRLVTATTTEILNGNPNLSNKIESRINKLFERKLPVAPNMKGGFYPGDEAAGGAFN